MEYYDIVIIGAGPGGLAAANQAKRLGVGRVLVLERNERVGGILNQCIHDGFGVDRFNEALSGGEYIARFAKEAISLGVEILCDAMVLSLTAERQISYVTKKGQFTVQAGAVILCTGCRERTRGAIALPGTRPAGVYTAGVVQHLVNVQNLSVGKRAVILGSGDIGLIMARRLTLEGMEIACVLEKLPYCSGLERNVRQCLQDYNIPLHLSTTVIEIKGREHLRSVVIAQVDEKGAPISGSEKEVFCDTLILSVGLIPENELAKACGIKMDPITGGALVDATLMSSVPGVFAAGNCLQVHDLVDNVSAEAEQAAYWATAFINGQTPTEKQLQVSAGDGVRYVLPRYILPEHKTILSLRVKAPCRQQRVCIQTETGTELSGKNMLRLSPAEMLRLNAVTREDISVSLKTLPAKTNPDIHNSLTCIVCPNGCSLDVQKGENGSWTVKGALCKRGVEYATQEMTAPMRSLTTSIPVTGGARPMVSLRSCQLLPKESLRSTVAALQGCSVPAPVKVGDVLTINGIAYFATDAVEALS